MLIQRQASLRPALVLATNLQTAVGSVRQQTEPPRVTPRTPSSEMLEDPVRILL